MPPYPGPWGPGGPGMPNAMMMPPPPGVQGPNGGNKQHKGGKGFSTATASSAAKFNQAADGDVQAAAGDVDT